MVNAPPQQYFCLQQDCDCTKANDGIQSPMLIAGTRLEYLSLYILIFTTMELTKSWSSPISGFPLCIRVCGVNVCNVDGGGITSDGVHGVDGAGIGDADTCSSQFLVL